MSTYSNEGEQPSGQSQPNPIQVPRIVQDDESINLEDRTVSSQRPRPSELNLIRPWELGLGVPGEPGDSPSGSSLHAPSSVCDDYGISKIIEAGIARPGTYGSHESWLLGVGSGPRADNPEYQQGIELQPEATTTTQRIKDILGEAKTWLLSPDQQKWLPYSRLDRIFSQEVVEGLLLEEFPELETDDERLTFLGHLICKPRTYQGVGAKANQKTQCLRLFAALFLAGLISRVIEIVGSGMTDSDLPIVVENGNSVKGRDRTYLEVFKSWDTLELDRLEMYQWRFLAPFFAKGNVENEQESSVLFYPLEHPKTIFPWIEHLGWNDDKGPHGGHGKVCRVKIHRAHHNLLDGSDGNPDFAVKKLYSDNKGDLDKEVRNLKITSVDANKHDNLITLLSTFQWKTSFYMIFPWADSNLKEFWENFDNPPHCHENILWVAHQCRGIASGLDAIHRVGRKSLLPGQARETIVGRHGDIKPENVLWYGPNEAANGHVGGMLRISDFGLAEFHRRSSQYGDLRTVPITLTYRAPEAELGNNKISSPYDIWALGCLYLEFATWYLMGFDALWVIFCDLRVNEDPDDSWQEDTFYKMVTVSDTDGRERNGNNGLAAVVKRSVFDWINKLHAHEDCSHYIHDLLQYIEGNMLQVNQKKRHLSQQVFRTLDLMLERGKHEPGYLTEPKPWPLKRPTDDSELEASRLNPSKEDNALIYGEKKIPEHKGSVDQEPGDPVEERCQSTHARTDSKISDKIIVSDMTESPTEFDQQRDFRSLGSQAPVLGTTPHVSSSGNMEALHAGADQAQALLPNQDQVESQPGSRSESVFAPPPRDVGEISGKEDPAPASANLSLPQPNPRSSDSPPPEENSLPRPSGNSTATSPRPTDGPRRPTLELAPPSLWSKLYRKLQRLLCCCI
ncbi:hypothetical protein MKZ38_000547 [Zalerion maritima]|uniref:Protein kinase domain-containing protein n=1 Tax=Zalerion maritima TaxID=339359 RepID=A0AAD5RST0_9PEZI|nr:hypothetical protein MKZ38_000547 [Zalerion maritima]